MYSDGSFTLMCVRNQHNILKQLSSNFKKKSQLKKYWSGVSFPFPGDLPDPGIEALSLVSPALASGFFNPEPSQSTGKDSQNLCAQTGNTAEGVLYLSTRHYT